MRLKAESKESQAKFVAKIKKLFENPEMIVPECNTKGFSCPFEKYKKKIIKAHKSGSFDKFARSNDEFLRGLSETEKILETEKLPLTGVIKTPLGSLNYVKRGDTDPIVLGGIQNYDNELWRSLAFSKLMKRGNIKIYTSRNYYTASCKGQGPGIEFFKDVLNENGVEYSEKDSVLQISGEGKYIDVMHFSGVIIRINSGSRKNTVALLAKHFISADISRDFNFASGYLEKWKNRGEKDLFNGYLAGSLSDRDFIEKIISQRIKSATDSGALIIGETEFSDVNEFIKKNEIDADLGEVISGVIRSFGGIYMDEPSSRKLLEILWPKYSFEILSGLFNGIDKSDVASLKGNPLEQIQAMREKIRHDEIKENLHMKPWSPDSEFLKEVIADARIRGVSEAINLGERTQKKSDIQEAILFALYLINEGGDQVKWKFSEDIRDKGKKMEESIKLLIKCPEENLDENFNSMSAMVK
ncbi:MAG: hypothetical protein M1159_04615 [Candidatus Thermoplasmatota archaeon]|jgi:hypothetical protein|nr:hypothetical protein [Candidatus Thermoplasmatota archaeon]MCL5787683.1 hypothetical protein [Candidatus Thermoplasmatota archaeon]